MNVTDLRIGLETLGVWGSAYLLTAGTITLILYIWVLVVVLLNPGNKFRNPFYKLLLSLGLCDVIIILVYDFYAVICFNLGKWIFGSQVDAVIASVAQGATYTAQVIQIVYAVNRFCAAVFVTEYNSMFKNSVSYILIGVCYSFGFGTIVVVLSLGGVYHLYLDWAVLFPWPWMSAVAEFMSVVYEKILALVVGCSVLILYGTSYVVIVLRKISESVSLNENEQQSIFNIENRLLVIGTLQALFFIIGYYNFYILYGLVPLWFNFHLFTLFARASPYLYMACDGQLRRAMIPRKNNAISPIAAPAQLQGLRNIPANPRV